MADNVNLIRENAPLSYDPAATGADYSPFHIVSGTPSISSSKLRLNATVVQTKAMAIMGELTMSIAVPVAPTAGQARKFGFLTASYPTIGSAYFEVTGATFRAVSYDDAGTAETTTITWLTAWTATATKYRIEWKEGAIMFYVGDVLYATHITRMGRFLQSVTLSNSASDNMDTGYFILRDAAKVGGVTVSSVQGNAISGGADFGAPVKIGMVYNSTQPTVTTGQRVDAQGDNRGNLKVFLASKLDLSNDKVGAAMIASASAAGGSVLIDTSVDNSAQTLHAAVGNLYFVNVINGNTTFNVANSFLQIYDTASPTVGTTTPISILEVPANGWADRTYFYPLTFGTAKTYAATTTPLGSGAPANNLVAEFQYI